mgnify:CR=1 FL=1
MSLFNPDPNYRDPKFEESLKPAAGSIEDVDMFNMPPAGHSLTDPPGKRAYERPPIHSDPEKAFDFIAKKIQEPDTEENFLSLMAGGVPIEAIVNTITFAGFTEGYWTPDVSEMLKPPLSLHFIGIALENKIPATMFTKNPVKTKNQQSVSDEDMLAMMKENRPDMYNDFMLKLDNAEQELNTQEIAENEQIPEEEEDSFLTLEEEI